MRTDENRSKLLRVPERDILTMLNWRRYQFIHLPVIKGLPEGAVVAAVDYDFCCRAFLIRVEHPSFDPVPLGERIPELEYAEIAWAQAGVEEGATMSLAATDVVTPIGPSPAPSADKKPWEFLGPPPRP